MWRPDNWRQIIEGIKIPFPLKPFPLHELECMEAGADAMLEALRAGGVHYVDVALGRGTDVFIPDEEA